MNTIDFAFSSTPLFGWHGYIATDLTATWKHCHVNICSTFNVLQCANVSPILIDPIFISFTQCHDSLSSVKHLQQLHWLFRNVVRILSGQILIVHRTSDEYHCLTKYHMHNDFFSWKRIYQEQLNSHITNVNQNILTIKANKGLLLYLTFGIHI